MSAATVPPRPVGVSRWVTLVFLSLAQLMIALDATIMNVALPSVQRELGFSDADRQWVITAYTLAFGGLLLLGGRVGDRIGRRRAFVVGLVGFAAASAAAGAATGITVLAVARAAQGAFGALLAPAVLALIAVGFTEPRERARAFAVFGAIAGGGGAAGLLLGGVLTETVGWRACLYLNLPVALVAAAGARRMSGLGPGRARRLDLPGAALATCGLVAIVLGCSRATDLGWRSATVLGLFAAAAVLLTGFAWWESRTRAPLLPLRLLADRDRVGAYLAVAFAVAGMLGSFLLLTYFVQVVLGYQPIRAGLAFLPLSAAVLVSAQLVAAPLAPRRAPRDLIVPGLLVAATGMVLLSGLRPDSGYLTGLLPAEVLLGLGIGVVFTPAISTATRAVAPGDAGVAAAVVTTAQQLGGSVGVAVLNTVWTSAAAERPAPGAPPVPTAALAHGYTVAATVAAAFLATGALLAAVLITARPRPGGNP